MTALPFRKMNGIGNEILVVDLRATSVVLTPAAVQAAARQVGFDQLMAIHPSRTPGTDAFLDIYNVDGSPSAACGNGTRCVAALLLDEEGRDELLLESPAGLLPVRRAGTAITVDMGAPRLAWDEIPLATPVPDTAAFDLQPAIAEAARLGRPGAVSMGNPHIVFWVDDADAVDLAVLGPILEHHPMFPERANISLATMTGPADIALRVWERGAGLTRACGSAACATAVAAVRTGRAGRNVTIYLPGGALQIEWRDSDGHVLMTGAWELEFSGALDLPEPVQA